MRVSYLSLSEHRCTIQFYDCNFRCKACFAPNNGAYTEVTPEQLAARLKQFDVEEVMLAGGEPTLHKKELLTFIKLCDTKTILSTNGFLLDTEFIRGMEYANLDEVHIDMKAYSHE
ncbi:MAG: radical SAM protein, partial [Methanosarcinales archaeon]